MLFILCPSPARLTLNLIYFLSPAQDWWWFYAQSCGVGSFLDVLVNHILAPQVWYLVWFLTKTVFYRVRFIHTHIWLCPVNYIYDTWQWVWLHFSTGPKIHICANLHLWLEGRVVHGKALKCLLMPIRDRIRLWSHLSLRLDSHHVTEAAWNLGIWYKQDTQAPNVWKCPSRGEPMQS